MRSVLHPDMDIEDPQLIIRIIARKFRRDDLRVPDPLRRKIRFSFLYAEMDRSTGPSAVPRKMKAEDSRKSIPAVCRTYGKEHDCGNRSVGQTVTTV